MELEETRKSRAAKQFRNILISMLALTAVIVVVGVAYTWYMGQQPENDSAIAPPVEYKPVPTVKRTKVDPNAVVGASVQMLTTPVTPGSNASMTVKTNPEAECDIVVTYDQTKSTDSGLKPKVADDAGIVSWAWTIEVSVPLGKWPVEVNCKNNKNSAMVRGDLEVVRQLN